MADRIGTAVLVGDFEPRSPEWHAARAAGLGGSEVAAVLGLSPWESRFSLWMRKAGLIDPQPDNPEMEWGRRLEPAVADKYADDNPGLHVLPVGTYRHEDRPWQLANPDRLCWDRETVSMVASFAGVEPVGLLEVKTALYADGWGDTDTGVIPPYYRCQTQWYLDTFGLPAGELVVLIGGHDYRRYVIEADAEDQAFMRAEAEAFLATIAAGDLPDLDAHAATYTAVRELHPEIEPRTVDLPALTAKAWVAARERLDEAKQAEQLARTQIATAMGQAHKARYGDRVLASRQSKGGGTPYVVAARNLPTLEQLTQETAS